MGRRWHYVSSCRRDFAPASEWVRSVFAWRLFHRRPGGSRGVARRGRASSGAGNGAYWGGLDAALTGVPGSGRK